MEIKIDDIRPFYQKKIRLFTKKGFTYVGEIVSFGTEYVRFKDKYEKQHFFPITEIEHLEELS